MVRQIRRNQARIGIFVLLLFVVSLLLPVPAVLSQDTESPLLVIVPDEATIFTGETQQYRAFLSFDGGDTWGDDVTEECFWQVMDTAIGETTDTDGLFRGIAPGETLVYAAYEGVDRRILTHVAIIEAEGRAVLIVQEAPEEIEVWLEVTPQTATIAVGETQQYSAHLRSTDPALEEEVTEESTWTLDDPLIATPTANEGEYRGESEGSGFVTAEYMYEPEEVDPVPLSDEAELIVWEEEDDDTPDDVPETEDLPEGEIINRQPGYITLSEPQHLGNPGDEFVLNYDNTKMDGNPDRYPRVFYFNDDYEKWVALASYTQSPGAVKAVNDGDYSGWFVVFGCIQPSFTDITAAQQWAEPTANRMNGLGLLEGYKVEDDPASLVRPAGLERTITRAELTAMVARILGLAPGETHLYPTLTYLSDVENESILQLNYSDADQMTDHWAKPYIAAMTEAGLVRAKGDRFAPQDEMTRIEAAVLISDALQDVPGFGHPADLTVYTDYEQIPAWAVGEVAEGTVTGYPDGSLRPNLPINRAEAMTLLLRLLRGFGW